jgi:hypothetical protein
MRAAMSALLAVWAAAALLVVVPAAGADGNRHHAGPATVLFHFRDDRITESSGLVDLGDGLMATVNDSGDGPYVYVIDPGGRTVGVTDYGGRAVDVESMAPIDAGHVWVGDTGGNTTTRTSVQVYRVPVGRADRTVQAPAYDLAYPDGAHDAETLLVGPHTGRLYVVTKSVTGGTVYAAPRHLAAGRPNRLRPIGKVPGLLTDGSFLPDGRHLLLRDYAGAAVYTFPGLTRVGPWFALPRQQQGEGLSVGPAGHRGTAGRAARAGAAGAGRSCRRHRAPGLVAPLPPAAPAAAATGSARVVGQRVARRGGAARRRLAVGAPASPPLTRG